MKFKNFNSVENYWVIFIRENNKKLGKLIHIAGIAENEEGFLCALILNEDGTFSDVRDFINFHKVIYSPKDWTNQTCGI